MHCSKEGKCMAPTVGRPLLWAVLLGTDVLLAAETQVRRLEEELRLEEDMQLSTALLVLGLVTRQESRISWRPYHAFNKARKAPVAMD